MSQSCVYTKKQVSNAVTCLSVLLLWKTIDKIIVHLSKFSAYFVWLDLYSGLLCERVQTVLD